jgi:hypothetical protein
MRSQRQDDAHLEVDAMISVDAVTTSPSKLASECRSGPCST